MPSVGEMPAAARAAYWKLDDLSDSASGTYGLTASGATSTTQAKFGTAYNFVKASKHYLYKDAAAVLTGSYTMSGWIWLTNIQSTGVHEYVMLCWIDTTSKTRRSLGYLMNSGSYQMRSYRQCGVNMATYDIATYTITLPTSTWVHWAATWDGSTISLFYNGQRVGFAASSANGSGSNVPTTNKTAIGNAVENTTGYSTTGQFNHNGNIDEVILDNRAWTAEEVRRYYSHTKGRLSPRMVM